MILAVMRVQLLKEFLAFYKMSVEVCIRNNWIIKNIFRSMEFTELQSQNWVISIRDFWISYLLAKFCPSILWALLLEKRTFADRTGCEEYCELDAVFFWIFLLFSWLSKNYYFSGGNMGLTDFGVREYPSRESEPLRWLLEPELLRPDRRPRGIRVGVIIAPLSDAAFDGFLKT